MKLKEEVRGERLDRAVARALSDDGRPTSVREVKEALKSGDIRVDGGRAQPGAVARPGQEVDLHRFVPREEARVFADDALAARVGVVFEDAEFLVLDKPSGAPTHPLRHAEPHTLLGAAVHRCPEIERAGPPLEGGLCHRLDVETSGVVVFAKSAEVKSWVRAAFSECTVEKQYFALVLDPEGRWDQPGVIDKAIVGLTQSVRVADSDEPGGLPAQTEVFRRAKLGPYAWVEARPATGRRHQIRVHLQSEGTPIVGDALYGGPLDVAPRLALHAASIQLPDRPRWTAAVPEELRDMLSVLGADPENLT